MPSSQPSGAATSPGDRPRKRIKLEEAAAAVASAGSTLGARRRRVTDEKRREMAGLKRSYTEHLTELFFLQNGGNVIDYFAWKRRPTLQLLQFLQSGQLDSDEDEEEEEQGVDNEVGGAAALGETLRNTLDACDTGGGKGLGARRADLQMCWKWQCILGGGGGGGDF